MNTIAIKLTDEQVAAIEQHRSQHPGAGILAQPFTDPRHPQCGNMGVTIVPASQIEHVCWMLDAIWMHRAKEQKAVTA